MRLRRDMSGPGNTNLPRYLAKTEDVYEAVRRYDFNVSKIIISFSFEDPCFSDVKWGKPKFYI